MEMKYLARSPNPNADWLTKLPEELGHAAATHWEGVVDGRLDNLPISCPQGDGPL